VRTLAFCDAPLIAQRELEEGGAPSARGARPLRSVFAHMKNDTSAMFGLIT